MKKKSILDMQRITVEEFKAADNESQLEDKADEALRQIEAKRYDTKKSFGTEVDMQIKYNKYIQVSDQSTGNIALLTLNEDSLYNIITESFGEDFKGYTINAEFDKENPSILKVKLSAMYLSIYNN